jgi:hypothetical protein
LPFGISINHFETITYKPSKVLGCFLFIKRFFKNFDTALLTFDEKLLFFTINLNQWIIMDEMNFNGKNLSEDQQDQLLFMMLVQQHQQIAMMGMGKIENPQTGQVERELKSAKFAIDTLLMLQKFTEGNLPKKLNSYLTETLNNLRMNYADEKEKGDDSKPDKEQQA